MRFLPYDTFTIQTQKSLADVISRLEPKIEEPRIFRGWNFGSDRAPYAGKISHTGFEIHRVIQYRNSFLPNIHGHFESSLQGTNVRVTMSLHPFVTVFLLFWFSIWYSISIPLFLSDVLSGDISFEAELFLGMPMVLLFVFWCAFWSEADRNRRELTAIILEQSLEKKSLRSFSPKPLWIVAIAVIILWNIFILNGFFSSSFQQGLQSPALIYCSQGKTQSPYCNFSLLHSLDGHPTTSAIAISPDGKILVSGGRDKAIKVWDIETGELKRTLQSDSGEIESLAIAPDGKTVVSGSGDRMVRIWDISSNQAPKMLKGHTNYDVNQIAISADGKAIVSGSYNEIKVWNLATGEPKATFPEQVSTEINIGPFTLGNIIPYFRLYSISPDGKTAIVELDNKFIAWNLETNQQTILPKSWLDNISNALISLDGKSVIITSYRQPKTFLKIWDLATGNLKAKKIISKSSRYYSLNIALSGDRAIVSTQEGLKVFNLQTAELEAILDNLEDNLESMRYLLLSPDGKLLVGITGDAVTKDVKIKIFKE
ncbi:hypothetical protein [Spirulina sp. 06S082]|uniref:WD40 repeat domain-containing protein n=1 Tax=Spirulina sp. 06S082 TaxID=3110248 RepID=UPI002B1F0638|nr:hypothetical protein [Spirulina sp. 06S082]MEA5471283.1 hypothetical protein [Spirulina sp. 06S082]